MPVKNIKSTLLSIIGISILLIVPDFIFSLVNKSFKLPHSLNVLFVIIPLSAAIVFNKYKLFSKIIITLIFILQFLQFSNIAYFGNQLSPYALILMQSEINDVLLETKNSFLNFLYIIPIVLIPCLLMWGMLKIKTIKNKIGTFFLVVFFTVPGISLYKINVPRYLPNEVDFTIVNSLKAFFGYFILNIKQCKIKNYDDYQVIDLKSDNYQEPITIVYIIGESVNYRHMSLFGYNRKTTPKLENLAKEKNVYYAKGISGGIATMASTKFMMNIIYEADNINQMLKEDTNLFKLAKSKGFKTFYLSAQSDTLLSSVGCAKYIDELFTRNSDRKNIDKFKDEYLFEILDSKKFDKKNFIVLHQRSIHAPYPKTFSENYKDKKIFKNSDNETIDDYDNAMLYNDYLISKMFERFNKQKNGKYYIVWASDHNELLGEREIWGHGHGYLYPELGDIPFLFQSNDENFLNEIKKINKPTHYEVGKKIANIIGYEIKNPNEEKNFCYLSGIDPIKNCGFLKLKK